MDPIRGFENYKNFQDETELNKNRIYLHSAALLQHGCNVENLVYYLGGTHVGANRNIPKILKDLKKGVQPTVLAEIKRVFEHRSPRKINTTKTEKNLKDYYYYGNHDSVNDNEKEVDKVLLKDQITVKETHY
jgi:broad specificity polyphosphatase/5'/3'-nucleotidase SurE